MNLERLIVSKLPRFFRLGCFFVLLFIVLFIIQIVFLCSLMSHNLQELEAELFSFSLLSIFALLIVIVDAVCIWFFSRIYPKYYIKKSCVMCDVLYWVKREVEDETTNCLSCSNCGAVIYI